jgi:hypothetical protein
MVGSAAHRIDFTGMATATAMAVAGASAPPAEMR